MQIKQFSFQKPPVLVQNTTSKHISFKQSIKIAQTIPEAVEIAQNMGVEADYEAGSLYLANLINSSLKEYSDMGFPLPETILLKRTKENSFIIPYGKFDFPSTLIFYTTKDWSPAAMIKRNDLRQFSTDQPTHPIDHEFGHFLHSYYDRNGTFDKLRQRPLTDEELQKTIKAHISDYAASNYLDFISETFCKLRHKIAVPAALYEKYLRLGGPVIP